MPLIHSFWHRDYVATNENCLLLGEAVQANLLMVINILPLSFNDFF
jgi:hypothetical protein